MELEDDSVNEGDARDQTRTLVRVRLLRALAGTGVAKQGWLKHKPGVSGSGPFSPGWVFAVKAAPAGYAAEYSEKESSTK